MQKLVLEQKTDTIVEILNFIQQKFYLVKKFEYKTVPKFQKLDTNQFYVMFYGQSLRVFTAFVKNIQWISKKIDS